MDTQEILRQQLDRLEHEHHDLDAMIEKMLRDTTVNQIAVQRLKKRKLMIKDHISQIHSKILPDIIA
mgnify:CR=1 FL=1|tara:strand:+ start:3397 stop:3597 length:201 start_codon:yes stop_codon:yes gene_type:complete